MCVITVPERHYCEVGVKTSWGRAEGPGVSRAEWPRTAGPRGRVSQHSASVQLEKASSKAAAASSFLDFFFSGGRYRLCIFRRNLIGAGPGGRGGPCVHSPSGRERVSVPVAWSRVLTITQLNAAAVGSELFSLLSTTCLIMFLTGHYSRTKKHRLLQCQNTH